MSKISIIFGTYQRAIYLERSFIRYLNQSFKDIELVILDDWSTDQTESLCYSYAHDLNIVYIRPPYKEPGHWRDSASIINIGLRACSGELILLTHPEIMVGKDTLSAMWEHRKDGIYHAAKCYYLTQDNQKHLDEIDWKNNLLEVRNLPDFYSKDPEILGPVEEFTHHATDRHTYWESQIFSGMTRNTWREFGAMTEFERWGSVDVDFLHRRTVAGIHNLTELDPDTIVVHQNHDVKENEHFVLSPRKPEEVHIGLPNYANRASAMKGNLW